MLAFSYDFCCSFVNNFVFFFLNLIIFIVCSLKDSQIFFLQSLPLYTSCLFSMLLNHDIVDIERPNGIFSPAFVVNEFSGLFSHPSIKFFSQTFKICINNNWCFIRFSALIKF